jgi:hypothetical protein
VPQKKPFRIPFLMKKLYHAYYQPFTLSIDMKTASDINYLKLKNFDLYNKLFSSDGYHLNIRTANQLTTIINDNVRWVLK